MGIYYSAQVIVGLPRCEIQKEELIEDEELTVCPPYYDGNDADHAIAGLEYLATRDHQAAEIDWDQEKINQLKAEFKELTGQDAKVFISPCGY